MNSHSIYKFWIFTKGLFAVVAAGVLFGLFLINAAGNVSSSTILQAYASTTAQTQSTPGDSTPTTAATSTVTLDTTQNSTESNTDPKKETGSIQICKVVSDSTGTIVDGSENHGEFEISLYEDVEKNNLVDSASFDTPLDYTDNLLTDNGSSDDVECQTFDNLALDEYYYGEEEVSGSNWNTVKYNDQFKETVSTLNDFYSYNAQLFDGDASNDSARNKNADGHIILNESDSDRTLIVYNSYQQEEDDGGMPACKFSEEKHDLVVNFGTELLNSDGDKVATTSGAGSLSAGNYTVRLHSWDDASGQSQSSEQWNAVLKNGNMTVATAGPSKEIPDSPRPASTFASFNDVNLSDSIDTFVTRHVEQGGINSVTPICAAFEKEPEETPEKKDATVVAQKVVCEDESDLPNWSSSDIDISSSTVDEWVAQKDSCQLTSGWNFQWNVASANNPGDNEGIVDGWNTFGPTDMSGIATTTLTQETVSSTNKIWVREALKDGYQEFSGAKGSDESAEMWCHTDVKNYDNYDFIKSPSVDNTYYCAAFNASTSTENTDPDAHDDAATTAKVVSVDINVLSNDTDSDDDSISISQVGSAQNGTVATTSTAGEVRYTPDSGFVGGDIFTYTINDGNGGSDTAEVTVNVTEKGFVCEDLSGSSGWYGEYFNYTASHPDMQLPKGQWNADKGDPLGDEGSWQGDWYEDQYFEFAQVDSDLTFGGGFFPFGEDDYHFGAHWQATVTASSTGQYQYSLRSDDDSWVYVDGDLRVDNSGVHAPKSNDGDISLSAGTHQVEVFFAERHTTQSHLSFAFIEADDLRIHPFAPQCEEEPVNNAPSANDDAATTTENTTINVNVLANDTDPDGDLLSVVGVQQPTNGSTTITANNISYTPSNGFVGTDSFTYTIADTDNATSSATVTLAVTEEGDGGGGGDDAQCSDGIDNDEDGLVDANDPGCHTDRDPNDDDDSYNPEDDSEKNAPACSDDVDNDGDMHIDEEDDACHTDGDADDGDMTYNPDGDSENQPPTINVIGTNPQNIDKGQTYNDPGASASDPEDGDITDEIVASSSVNTNVAGTYTVTYNVTDSDGAAADEKTRTVKVKSTSDGDGNGGGSSSGGSGGGGGFDLEITNESAQEGDSDSSAVVTWETNTEATSRVVYGTTSISDADVDESEDDYGYHSGTSEVDNDTEDHEVNISGLEEGVTYYFRPVSDTNFTGEEIGDEVTLRFGQVAGAGTTVSSGASGQCSPYLDDFLKRGQDNDRLEVLKLQSFLITLEGYESVELTGEFGSATHDAVEDFQQRYADDVLSPWGYANNEPTGYVYITTKNKINEIICNREYPFSAEEDQEMEDFRSQLRSSAGGAQLNDNMEGVGGSVSGDVDAQAETQTRTEGEVAGGISGETAANSTGTATSSSNRSPAAALAAGVYTTFDGFVQSIGGAISSNAFLFFLLGVLIGWMLPQYIETKESSRQQEEAA